MPITIGKKPGSSFADPLGLLSDCHRRIEHFLGLLITVTAQARGGALTGEQRDALVAAGRYFREAAPLHKEDEERSLFPRMRASRDRRVRAALATLEELVEDHVVLDRGHVEVDTLIDRWMDDGSLPSNEVRRLVAVLQELRAIYERHIAIEDHDVFPLAGGTLDQGTIAVVGREMAARRGLKPGDAWM
ncbi:MAG: hemerythrin domain-containing protein [Nitrospirota bacterium]